MNRPLFLTFVSTIALALACGGDLNLEDELNRSISEAAPIEATPPAAPAAGAATTSFGGLNLPVGSGNVIASTDVSLNVQYTGGDAAQIAKDYDAAILAGGASPMYDLVESGGTYARSYGLNGKSVSLGVTSVTGNITVVVTLN